jgi:orotate phosphoribosyltransferase
MVIAVDRQELLGDAPGSISAVQVLENELGIKTVAILTMQDIFALMKDSLAHDVRRAWVEYYEQYGAVRMQ